MYVYNMYLCMHVRMQVSIKGGGINEVSPDDRGGKIVDNIIVV